MRWLDDSINLLLDGYSTLGSYCDWAIENSNPCREDPLRCCQCGAEARSHPLETSDEWLDPMKRPYLRRMCDGTLVLLELVDANASSDAPER